MNKVCVDADSVAYKACFSTQYWVYDVVEEGLSFRYHKDCYGWLALNYEQEDEFPDVVKRQVIEPINYTYHIADIIINGIKEDLQTDDLTLYLSGGSDTNFRYRIPYPVRYKSGRPDKPVALPDVRNYLCTKYNASITKGYEADDALGIFVTKHPEAVVARVDKDLAQIAGRHYHLDSKDEIEITPDDALRSLYFQLLMGDRVDSIIGIKGIGIKTAQKLLGNTTNEVLLDKIVREEYRKAFGEKWQEMYKANYDLLRILRTESEYEELKKVYEII